MSQHRINGSEAFKREPHVLIRSVPAGAFRRRRSRSAVAFIAGVVITGFFAVVVAAWMQGFLG